MIPEVKERIEQIRHGIVPEGYKINKDGIHPAEWFAKKIDQWLKLAERPVVLKDDESYQLVTVRRGFGGVDSRGNFLGKNVLVKNYYSVNTGDFIISKRQIAHGACGVVPEELNGSVVSNEYNVFIPQDDTNIHMFNLMMQSPHYRRLFYLMSDGVHIEKLLFKTQDWMRRTLAMPQFDEQQRIAEILTTQDKVIELKEKLLAEKQRQKKYLMQQLLTGKKRLPGFDGEWKRLPFTEVFSFLPTNTLSRDCMSETVGTVLNIHYGDVLVKYPEILDADKIGIPFIKHGFEPSNISYVRNGDVIIADTAEDLSVGKAVEIQNVSQRLIASGLHTMFCRPNHDLFAAGWLGYYINSSVFHDQLLPLISGVKVSSISKKEIIKTTISVPTIEEQRAIANILSVADVEIMLLNQDIEQEKQKKKALMQLLLTGIVRVNI